MRSLDACGASTLSASRGPAAGAAVAATAAGAGALGGGRDADNPPALTAIGVVMSGLETRCGLTV